MNTHELANDLAALHVTVDATKPRFEFSIGPDGLLLSMDAVVLAFFGIGFATVIIARVLRDAWKATR